MREAGCTRVRPGVARALTSAFLLLLASVATLEIRRDVSKESGTPWPELVAAPVAAWKNTFGSGAFEGNRRLLIAKNDFEDALEERSIVAAAALPGVQWALTRLLGAGNAQVVVGRKGWLYFRPAVDYLTGPGFLDPRVLDRRTAGGKAWAPPPRPNPLPAIADFAAQLAERGIGLVVIVTPVKAALHPEGLAPVLSRDVLPIENPSFAPFLDKLADLEIPAFSPAERLARTIRAKSWPQFLRTDTHWTPQAMEDAAENLVRFLARHVPLPGRNPVFYSRREVGVQGRGDLTKLLRLPDGERLFGSESVLIRPVMGPGNAPWTPDPNADVLVLGDSFTNIYSQSELGWGECAGFAEQLSYFLHRPVDKVAVNAGGPAAARERLVSMAAGGEDRLAGKRLVILQFSARELASGDWKLVDLSPARRASTIAAPIRRPEHGAPARGFVAWESWRSGEWRIWTRRLEGSAPRQLTPDEPGLQHCCPHISPDGSKIVYLSRSAPAGEYPEEASGDLRLLRMDGGGERTLVRDARPYEWGNRAATWRNERKLIYIGADKRTHLLDVDTAESSRLTAEPEEKMPWLIDPTLRHAVNGSPAFSRYDAGERRVVEARRRPGCEPYFSQDGSFGFWVAGGGGPIRWIDLRTRAVGTWIEKDDRRIHDAQRYVYFPMLSRDGRMLAFSASPGDHDHFQSNYDVFVAPVDPGSLALLGRPLRFTAHPASDRYPDVHVEALDLERWKREAPPIGGPAPIKAPLATGEPFEMRAVLQSCSRAPSLREISPYRAALIVCEWKAAQVLFGRPPGDRLRIAHWALRDGERQPIVSLRQNSVARLRVEPLSGVSQIEGYPIFNDLPADPDLPIHYSRGPD
ncbi:MAG: hypothetical protein JXO72_05695 [Vicinamibacteria bacterium]|nr:hypothetical protein [Vicinamibacteria bacterium]